MRRATRRGRPNPYSVALAGFVLQLGLGTVYAWSFFQSMLVRDHLWSYTDTAWAFALVILTMGLSAAWAGVNLPKYGPRKLAMTGAALFSLSYLLGGVALYLRSIPLFLLGYGLIGGMGIGLGYVTPVATVATWFPNRSSKVIDVVVMGFGVGGLLMTMVLAPFLLVEANGDLARVFILLGVVFAAVLMPATWFLQSPPGVQGSSATTTPDSRVTFAELGSVQFAGMWVVFFCNIVAGLAVISIQSPLLQEVWGLWDPSVEADALARSGATLIAFGSLCNGIGRLFWGTVSDHIGRVESFRLLLAAQIVLFGLLMTERNPQVFSVLVCCVLLCFGGGFATMPSFVRDVFGARRMPVMYGAMLTAMAAAGVVGPLMMASLKDNYPDRAVIYGFLMGVGFLGVGFVTSFLVSNDPYRPGKPTLDDLGIPSAYLGKT
ncbi:MAG: MFS transporter [Acidobacteriota bacterium]|nr:MFS transporter [Acidobacteriota bacterium]